MNRTQQIEQLSGAFKALRVLRPALTATNQAVCDSAVTRVQALLLQALPGLNPADFTAAERNALLELDATALRAFCAAKAQAENLQPPEAFVFPETY